MVMRRTPRYADEDTEPTSEKELRGWFAYGIAAEVFAVCGIGSFLPITLEQLARENGVLRSDGTTPCINHASDIQKRESAACVIHVFGAEVNTSSFALYTFSLAVMVQSLVLISIGAIADHGANRKKLVLVLAYTGSIASMSYLLVFPSIYLVGSLLAVIGIASLGNSFVLLNSFLPLLVENHPSMNKIESSELLRHPNHFDGDDESDDDLFEHDPLSDPTPGLDNTTSDTSSAGANLSNQISSKGVGLGYAASVFVQIICIGIIAMISKVFPAQSKTTIPLRVVLFVVGLWWAAFTIPTWRWLRPRPGPPLPTFVGTTGRHPWLSWISYVAFAWKALGKTLKIAVRLRQVVVFLIGWFLLSDANATVSGAAILFARTELELGTQALVLLSITATASGIVGAFTWPILSRRFGLASKHVIVLCICIFEVIPLYGLLGFIPFVKAWGVGGLQQPWEVYPLGFILGFVMGGLSSYCRSVFGRLVPPKHEAAFFALFAVTDKGSSVIGPTIIGRIVDSTGSMRAVFWFLAVLVIAPAPLMWLVDVDRGHQDAIRMSEKERGVGSTTGPGDYRPVSGAET